MENNIKLNNLKNKQILYIGKIFFEYHTEIKKAIMRKGAQVDFFPTEKFTFLYKIFKWSNSKLFKLYNTQYQQKILSQINGTNYDYILIIQGHQFSHDFFKRLKHNNPKAKMVMYHWDSIETHNYLEFTKYFDRVLSFDMMDCHHHKGIEYLPLFYTKSYQQLAEIAYNSNKPIDILFIGSLAKYRRYLHLKKIKKLCNEAGLNFYCHLYISRNQYIKYFLKGKPLNNIIRFNKLSSNEIIALMKQSKAVLDVSNNYQKGLTMRTFEVLGAGIKLITSNTNIKDESFYNKDCISIIDIDNFKLDMNFLNAKKIENKKNIMANYSLDQWINRIFKFDFS